ncbi:MAG: site-specific tyrosine recombinase/integron integrase [Candidatus Thermoplasmatota archaeon]
MFHEIIEKYKEYLLGDKKSLNTVKKYCYVVEKMLYWLGKEPDKVGAEDLEKYKEYLAIEKKYSKNSLYTIVKGIQSFYKFLGKEEVIKNFKAPKKPEPLPNYLSEEEAHRIIESAKENLRDYAIIVLFCYSGIRVSELCDLKVNDIDFNEKIIRIRGKGGKERIVVVEEKAIEAIKNYLNDRKGKEEIVFVGRKGPLTQREVQIVVKKYANIAKIKKKVTPHVLRHTLATTLLRHGADIRFIQKILGHSSIATTQVYTHVDEEALKEAYQKSKPKY